MAYKRKNDSLYIYGVFFAHVQRTWIKYLLVNSPFKFLVYQFSLLLCFQ